ncbi:putative aarF domain-containing protein kinase 1 [Portunus trituberculatus]|uniref:Putative aarF domain-containing protein kinase 1 n=1 Tax=Portunus trituberculatus TaxID=210409 RepID=A0A5B7D2P3_PORTR|nr:putative aarF domain-containing protein kinase 1 [Portunus trituberculatus]
MQENVILLTVATQVTTGGGGRGTPGSLCLQPRVWTFDYEQDEIKADAAKYLPEISAVLSRVPRQMLLIFKTNDLLRGIEFSLDTHKRIEIAS